jgi:hypothetical protein
LQTALLEMFLKKLKHQQKTFKQALIIWPGLPKMNIPQIPDIEEIKRKMAEANMNFPEPVSYQDQLQSIRDIPQPNLQNNFMGNSARNVMSQIQQPQMQSVGRPSMPMSGGFRPEFRAGGGGIDKAIYDLKFKLNG